MTASRVFLVLAGIVLIFAGLYRYFPVVLMHRGQYVRVRARCTGYDRRMAPSDSRMQYYPMFRFTAQSGLVVNAIYHQAGRQFETDRDYVIYYRRDRPRVIYCPRDRYRLLWTVLFTGFGILLLVLAASK